MAESPISKLSNQYHEWVRVHPRAARDFRDAIEDLLNDAGVIFDRVAARVTTWPSVKAKAKKKNADGSFMYSQPCDEIPAIMGVRVNVFHSTVIAEAISIFGNSFEVIKSVDKAAETRVAGGFGYGSHHLVLRVTDEMEDLADYVG